MAEEEADHLSRLSLKDFEEREIKIDRNWSGLEALTAVACLASEKLEEETIRKEKTEKERKSVESNGYWRNFVPRNGYEHGGSSRSCDDRPTWLPRVSVRNERVKYMERPVRNSVLDVHSKTGKEFVAVSDEPESSPGSKDKRTCLTKVSGRREREIALEKPATISVSDPCSNKKQGFKVGTRDKLLGDAMKSGIMASKDDYDEEWRAEYSKPKLKLKRGASRRDYNSEEKDLKSKKKVKRERYIVPEVTPDLPMEYREKIEKLNGSKIHLVIQKPLYTSDISDHQSRLLIPWKQIFSIEKFLNDDERAYLNQENEKPKVVNFFGPSFKEIKMSLKKRTMMKVKGGSSLSYVLITEWKGFKNDNKLKKGDIIQLWSFRTPADELCLAFVVVGKGGGKIDEANNNQNNNAGNVNNGGAKIDEANNKQNNSAGNGNGGGKLMTKIRTRTTMEVMAME